MTANRFVNHSLRGCYSIPHGSAGSAPRTRSNIARKRARFSCRHLYRVPSWRDMHDEQLRICLFMPRIPTLDASGMHPRGSKPVTCVPSGCIRDRIRRKKRYNPHASL